MSKSCMPKVGRHSFTKESLRRGRDGKRVEAIRGHGLKKNSLRVAVLDKTRRGRKFNKK